MKCGECFISVWACVYRNVYYEVLMFLFMLIYLVVEAMEQCPERILGNERQRACPKKCLQDKECGSKRQCLCDGQCGLSCVAPGQS